MILQNKTLAPSSKKNRLLIKVCLSKMLELMTNHLLMPRRPLTLSKKKWRLMRSKDRKMQK